MWDPNYNPDHEVVVGPIKIIYFPIGALELLYLPFNENTTVNPECLSYRSTKQISLLYMCILALVKLGRRGD